jgi:hypothetical protein
VLSLVGFFVLDAVSLLAIARDAERFPNTDAAGMLAMSLVFIDLGFIVFFAIAAGTRIRRWLWRRRMRIQGPDPAKAGTGRLGTVREHPGDSGPAGSRFP